MKKISSILCASIAFASLGIAEEQDNSDVTQKEKEIATTKEGSNKGLLSSKFDSKIDEILGSARFVKGFEFSFGNQSYVNYESQDRSTNLQNTGNASFDFGIRFDLSNSVKLDTLGIIGINGVGAGISSHVFLLDGLGISGSFKSTYVVNYLGSPAGGGGRSIPRRRWI